MNIIKGIPASPGIAAGEAFVLHEEEAIIPRYSIARNEVSAEWERFLKALTAARNDISSIRDKTSRDMGDDHAAIFDAHLLMLEDPEMLSALEESLGQYLYNIEWILHKYSQKIIGQIEGLNDPILQERSVDVHDITQRLLSHLMHRERSTVPEPGNDIILVSKNLLPSEFISMDKSRIKGMAMLVGGKTSHTAILARAFEIPAVLGIGNILKSIKTGQSIILDGDAGTVFLNPDKSEIARARKAIKKKEKREELFVRDAHLPATTQDGFSVKLKANLEVPEEALNALKHGAQGVGLFRSEFLFLTPGRPPDEETQYLAYRRVVEAMEGRPVTIRTLDVGGDKILPSFVMDEEVNPLLGWRAIRYCLFDKEMFLTQLRAILRASAHGDLRIMFPMISGVGELEATLEVLEAARESLASEGKKIAESIPVGIMIEVPGAAMTADIMAKRVDFMSIGTNDLIQYSLAVDRGNERVAYLYEPFHPAVLRFIKLAIDAGKKAGIPVAMCGEMASDLYALPVLLGLGLDEFSMSAIAIPEIKALIRSLTMDEARKLTEKVMLMESHSDVEAFLKAEIGKRVLPYG